MLPVPNTFRERRALLFRSEVEARAGATYIMHAKLSVCKFMIVNLVHESSSFDSTHSVRFICAQDDENSITMSFIFPFKETKRHAAVTTEKEERSPRGFGRGRMTFHLPYATN